MNQYVEVSSLGNAVLRGHPPVRGSRRIWIPHRKILRDNCQSPAGALGWEDRDTFCPSPKIRVFKQSITEQFVLLTISGDCVDILNLTHLYQ